MKKNCYLFLDTSFYLVLGLWDHAEQKWISYNRSQETKGAGVLHARIFEALEQNHLKIQDLAGIITIAGPGSYTGIRLAEGIAQVFDWHDIPHFSFYHFQIPRLLGVEKGMWLCSAYKGEIFSYKWTGDVSEKVLMFQNEVENYLQKNEYSKYTHYLETFPYSSLSLETSALIFDQAGSLFTQILSKNIQSEPFYFRALNVEFKKAKT